MTRTTGADPCTWEAEATSLGDIGLRPNAFDVESSTRHNDNYRAVAWTGRFLQWCIRVPAGMWHDVINIGAEPLRPFTVYASSHPRTVASRGWRCPGDERRRGAR